MEHLFIYGSLAPGKANHHHMAEIDGNWQRASLRGRLLEQGWGADLGFPGIVPDPQAKPVPGHLLSSSSLNQHWPRLDEFEGPAYQRLQVQVELADGALQSAWVYALREPK